MRFFKWRKQQKDLAVLNDRPELHWFEKIEHKLSSIISRKHLSEQIEFDQIEKWFKLKFVVF